MCCGKAELLLGCFHLQTYIAACIELSKLWRCAGCFKETRKGLAIVEVSVQERIVFGGAGGPISLSTIAGHAVGLYLICILPSILQLA